ncbi:MAG: YkgJ family cysteine cluster protein, partial [Candidatus Omnitrophica bacterium]|nr:YkgJ family cysteine cluster protein [Candidatus Omnitrophota bacterium]
MRKLKKFAGSETCLKCDGCCRYHEKNGIWAVKGIKLLKNPNPAQSEFICSFLNPEKNKCKIYSSRPFECELYPFLINQKDEKIFLAVDANCPLVKEKSNTAEFKKYAHYLFGALNKPGMKKILPKIAQSYPGVTDIFRLNKTPLREIAIKDKKIFDKYLKLNKHELA